MPRSDSSEMKDGAAADGAGVRGLRFSDDDTLNRMLATIVSEVNTYAEMQAGQIRRLNEIGIALSAEQNLDRLLEKILDEARAFSHADGGTLYLLNRDTNNLDFSFIQNDSMNIRLGGAGNPINWPPIPLQIAGLPNHANVSSHAALTGKVIAIPDVYGASTFDFSGPREFDRQTGYRSRSMVVIPMHNKENEVIGVLQLINSIDPASGGTVPFSRDNVSLIASLASQAAVAITNVRLYRDLERLFESFIVTIAKAIDEKSPYTAGHIRRVQELTMAIAARMNEKNVGVFETFHLNTDQMNELRIASWLHDVGKIITPEHIVDKATKLETIRDGFPLIESRYGAFRQEEKLRVQEAKLALFSSGNPPPDALAGLDGQLSRADAILCEELRFIAACNQPGESLDQEKIERLRGIAATRRHINGLEVPSLTDQELANLSITRGSLNAAERHIIENHALVTMKMLNCLPFPHKLSHVPEYASFHHEKLDGSGYPFHLAAGDLPYQARIIAIADIFEALTARDRPYKRAISVDKALEIMDRMKRDGHIDPDIYDLFVRDGVYKEYADRRLDEGRHGPA
jgi:HD-GYP domain-containing protein (c-di-GMP phosphodiesterase class II)